VPATGEETISPEFLEKPAAEISDTEEADGAQREAITRSKALKDGLYDYMFSRLHTHADTSISYNDNIYLLHKKTGDVIPTVRPGVSLLLGSKDLRVSGRPRSYCEIDAGYATDYYIRARLNHNNPYATINIQGVGPRYRVRLSNYFLKAQQPAQVINSGEPGLVGYQMNITNLGFEYIRGRARLLIGYKRNEKDYTGSYKTTNSILDQGLNVTASINPSITPKTTFFFEYEYGTFDYYKAPNNLGDFAYHYFWIGAKGKLLKKIYGVVKAGEELRRADPTGELKNAFVIRGDLFYIYSKKLRFSMHLARENWAATNRSQGFNTAYIVSLRGIWDFNPQLTFTCGAKYEYDSYESTGKHDNTCGPFLIRFDYKVNKFTTIGAEYNFTRRDSTRADCKYNNSNIIGRMGMVF